MGFRVRVSLNCPLCVPCNRDSCNTTRLSDGNDSICCISRSVKDLSQLRGLAGAGVSDDHHHSVVRDGIQNWSLVLIDRQHSLLSLLLLLHRHPYHAQRLQLKGYRILQPFPAFARAPPLNPQKPVTRVSCFFDNFFRLRKKKTICCCCCCCCNDQCSSIEQIRESENSGSMRIKVMSKAGRQRRFRAQGSQLRVSGAKLLQLLLFFPRF